MLQKNIVRVFLLNATAMITGKIFKSYAVDVNSFKDIVPRIISKVQQSGRKILILCCNEEMVKFLDDKLWTFTPDAFLPHGVAGGEYDEHQPVLISTKFTTANKADTVCIVWGTGEKDPNNLEVFLENIKNGDQNSCVSTIMHIFCLPESGLFEEDQDQNPIYEVTKNGLFSSMEYNVFDGEKWGTV